LPRNKAKTNEKAIKSLDLARFIACHALKLEKDIKKAIKKMQMPRFIAFWFCLKENGFEFATLAMFEQ